MEGEFLEAENEEEEESMAIGNDPYGDLGGPNGYAQDEEGNWYAD